MFDWQHVQTDPNFANYRYQPDSGRIVLLDFGAARAFEKPFAEAFRALLRAVMAGDRAAVMAGLDALGLAPADLPAGQLRLIEEMVALGLPVLATEHVDFGDTRLLAAMRDKGMALGVEEDFRHIPPWDVLYLQRKLGGLVLLATRLRARVPLRSLVAAVT